MEEIAKLFIELLKAHNRVSLPGMGAFVTAPQPAAIGKNKIAPPTKNVTFSKSETWNDGLLEQRCAERYSVSVEEAQKRLRQLITDICFELDANGKLTLPGLGVLKQSPSRDISFVMDKNLNLKGDSYGLPELAVAPEAAKVEAAVPPVGKKEAATSAAKVHGWEGQPEKRTGWASLGKNNISLLILLGIIVVAISAMAMFMALNRSKSVQDFTLQAEAEAPQEEAYPELPPQDDEEEEQQQEEEEEEYPDEAPPAKRVATPAPVRASQPKPAAPRASAPRQARCKYCIIVANFNTHEGARLKAERYKEKGYSAEVVADPEKGRYRVSLNSYPTHEAAKRHLNEGLQFAKDAWVLEVCK